jgi:hypothetical protein
VLTNAFLAAILAVTAPVPAPEPEPIVPEVVETVIPLCKEHYIRHVRGEKGWLGRQMDLAGLAPHLRTLVEGVCLSFYKGFDEGFKEGKKQSVYGKPQ